MSFTTDPLCYHDVEMMRAVSTHAIDYGCKVVIELTNESELRLVTLHTGSCETFK